MKYITVFLIFIAINSTAQEIFESENTKIIHYDSRKSFIIPYTIRCFDNALDFHKRLFNYEPTGEITVVLEDFGDYGNASTLAAPFNIINIGLSPFSYAFETFPAGERIFSLMNHELVHMAALDNTSKQDRFFRKLFFGKVVPTSDHPISMFYSFLTIPRYYAPRWYHEGIASYVDTWMSGGKGNAMGNYDEMFFRTKILEDAKIYSAQGLESEGTTSDFQGVTNSYLYGTRFMGYLANQYGPEKIIEWVKREDESSSFFAKQFKQIFGFSIDKGWDDWLTFEKAFQEENIELINENPITKVTSITEKILGSVSYAHFDEKRNKIYVAVNYPGKVPFLAAIDLSNGDIEHLTDIKGAALFYVSSVIYDEAADKIYFTTDNNAQRDLNSYDLKTKKVKLLNEDARFGDLALNPIDKSIWGVKHDNGFSTIIRIIEHDSTKNNPTPYSSKFDGMITLRYGDDIFDMDISPDGKYLSAAVSDYKGTQKLMLYEIDAFTGFESKSQVLFDFDDASPQSFRFTKDGKYLVGTSYYSGISNVYRINLSTFDGEGEGVEVMSNAATGFFRPVVLDSSRLFVFEYKSKGFQPSIIKNKPVDALSSINFLGTKTAESHDFVKKWYTKRPSQVKASNDTTTAATSFYSTLKEFQLTAAYPTLVGYQNFMGVGYKFNFRDPLWLTEMNLTFSYTPTQWFNSLSDDPNESNTLAEDETFHASINFTTGNFFFRFAYNPANFYDLFGPTKRSRKGISGGIDWSPTLIWNPPITLFLDLGVGGFYGLEKSNEFQQLSYATFDGNLFFDFYAALSYSFVKNSIGAVDDEKGITAGLEASTAYTAGQIYPSLVGNLDLGIPLPINHTSVWLRSAFGKSFADELNPFTRYGFAAFGNNYIDSWNAKQYRGTYAFPGLTYSDKRYIESRDFGKLMVDLILPPIRYKKLGFFNLFANWTQASVFTSVLYSQDFYPDGGGHPKNAQYIFDIPNPLGVSSDDPIWTDVFVNFGAQIDTRIVLFSLLPSTISIGVARAYDMVSGDSYDEFMISLKLLN